MNIICCFDTSSHSSGQSVKCHGLQFISVRRRHIAIADTYHAEKNTVIYKYAVTLYLVLPGNILIASFQLSNLQRNIGSYSDVNQCLAFV